MITLSINTLAPNQLISYFLMAGYLWHIENLPLLTDDSWDELCEAIHKNWEQITHKHREYIDKDFLKAHTAFYIRAEQYPEIVKRAALQLYDERGIGAWQQISTKQPVKP